jgi:peptidoglycan L-alanyl-D-glutamate endopeptidase CwlK
VINSRKLEDLLPPVRERVERMIAACDAEGIDLLVTSTYRDNASQEALYAQGRTAPGRIVTNARAGQSYHNYRCAVDVVAIRGRVIGSGLKSFRTSSTPLA